MRRPSKSRDGAPRPTHERVFRWAALWIFRPLATALAWDALLVCLVWGVSRAVGDRWVWSQYAFWMPTVVFVAAAWTLLVAHLLLRPLALWRRRRWTGSRSVWPALVACVLLAAWWSLGEWRVHRYLPGLRPAAPEAYPDRVRIAFWNLASGARRQGIPERIAEQRPDILLISNPSGYTNSAYRAALLRSVTDPEGDRADQPLQGHFLAVTSTFVASRFPILRHAFIPVRPLQRANAATGGRFVYLEFAVPDAPGGEPLRVVIADLPSNVGLHRRRVMEHAAAAAKAFTGPVYKADSIGRWLIDEDADPTVLLERAHFITGDFNAPSDSPSVRRIVGGRTEAHDAAGRGNPGTWRHDMPFWAIDAAFVGGGWRPVGFRTVGGPMLSVERSGEVWHEPFHRMIVVDIAPR